MLLIFIFLIPNVANIINIIVDCNIVTKDYKLYILSYNQKKYFKINLNNNLCLINEFQRKVTFT